MTNDVTMISCENQRIVYYRVNSCSLSFFPFLVSKNCDEVNRVRTPTNSTSQDTPHRKVEKMAHIGTPITWNCFHHDDPEHKFGRITRRLTFEPIYASKVFVSFFECFGLNTTFRRMPRRVEKYKFWGHNLLSIKLNSS